MDWNHGTEKVLRLALLTLLLFLAVSALLAASADTVVSSWTEGDWTYNELQDSVGRIYKEIVGYSGTDTVLTIPSDAVSIGEGVFENNTSLTNVELPPYLEFIRANAFKGCTALQDLQLNTYLNEIGGSAFEGCTSLSEITLHTYLKRVGGNAFKDCAALTSLNMENSSEVNSLTKYAVLTEIGDGAFENCPIEGEIAIPTSVKTIGADAFSGCGSIAQVTFTDYTVTTVTATSASTTYHAPELESIGANAFKDCVSLEAIDIPYSVTTLGAGAFEGCSALAEANIKSSRKISQIPDRLFKDTALRKIVLPNVTGIGVDAFAGCDALETVYKPDGIQYAFSPDVSVFSYGEYIRPDSGQAGVAITGYEGSAESLAVDAQIVGYTTLAIDAEAFKDNTFLTHIDLSDSLYYIGANAFMGCTALTEIEIPSSVKSLGTMIFEDCDNLETITLLCENSTAEGAIFDSDTTVCYARPLCTTVQNLGDAAGDFRFTDLDDHDWVYRQLSASTAETQGYGAQPRLMACQYNGTEQAELSVLEGVNILGKRLFYNHQELTCVDLPETLVYIDAEAFSHAEALQAAVIPEGVTHIGYKAFEYCIRISSVSLPDSLKELGDYTFTNCTRVRDIELPDNMERVGVNVLGEADVAGARTFKVNLSSHTATLLGSYSFFYDKVNPDYRYRWINGLYLNKYLGSEEQITISDQVVGIDQYAFCILSSSGSVQSYNATLKEITIPASVKVIGQSALRQASALEKVVFEGPLTVISEYAFAAAPKLETVEFHGAVNLIDNSAFENCDSLTSLTFDGSVGQIGNSAFADCDALESVILPEGTLSIGGSAFNKCESLTHVDIPDSVTGIGSKAFFRSPIAEVTLKDTGVTIGSRAFSLPTRVYCALESDTAHRLSDSLCLFAPNQLDAAHAALRDMMLRYVREYETGVEELRFYYYFGSEPFIRLYDHIDSMGGRAYPNDPYYLGGYNSYYTGGFNPHNGTGGLSDQEMAAGHLNGARILAEEGSAMAKMIGASRYGFTPDQTSEYDYSYVGDDLYIFKAYLPDGGDVLTITELPEDVSGVWEESFGASDYRGIPEDVRFECPVGSAMAVAVSKGYAFEDSDSPMLWLRYSTDGAKCTAIKCAQGAVDVVIPDGVTDIGDECFMGDWVYNYDEEMCIDYSYVESNTALKSVYLPESLKHIGTFAFRACTALETINTEHVQSVSDFAFCACSSLQTVDLRQLQSIGQGMFYNASVQDLYLSCAYDGFGFMPSDEEYPDPYYDTWSAHPLGGIYNLHLEEGITSLGENALYSVQNCYMPRSLIAIDDNNWPTVHAYSDSYASEWASERTGRFIPIPDEGWDLKWQDEKLYIVGYHGEDEFIYSLPDGVEGILPGAAFNGVKFIAPDPDSDFAHMVEAFYTSEDSAFRLAWKDDALELVAFEGSDEEVIVPDGVMRIGSRMFSDHDQIRSLTLPASLTEIDEQLIWPETVYAPSDSYAAKWQSEHFGSFVPVSDTDWALKWQDDALYIAGYRGTEGYIYSWPEDTQTPLPGVDLEGYRFISPDVNSDFAHSVTAFYTSEDSSLRLGWEDDALVLLAHEKTETEVTVPEGVTRIPENVFTNDATLNIVTLPDSLTEIGDRVFDMCTSLNTVNLSENSALTRVGDYAFNYCFSLPGITLPDSVTEIGDHAFYNCSCLSSINMPASLTEIGDHAFSGCQPLTAPALPKGLKRIGSHAFCTGGEGWVDFGTLVLPEGLESLGSDVIDYGELTLPDNLTQIGPQCVELYVNIESVTAGNLPADTAFRDRTDGNAYAVQDDGIYLTRWSNRADAPFAMSGEAMGLLINGSEAVIGNTDLTSITLPVGVTEFRRNGEANCAFIENNDQLTTLSIPEGVTSLPERTAWNNPSLIYLELPASLTAIDPEAFDGGISIVLGHVGSYAQTYADDNGLLFIDVDDPDSIADSVTIVPVVTSLYAGDEISLSDLVRVMPEIGGNMPLSAESVTPNIVSVEGTTVRALKGGSARLYVMVEDHDLTEVPVDLTVYNPVEDFTVPETVYVKVNESVYVRCEDIVPAEWTDGRFEWDLGRYGTAGDCSGVDIYPTQRGTVQATVTSASGITKGFRIIAYNNMGNITVSADNETMIVHESRPVTVKIALDSVAHTNPAGLYTLESSDPDVIRVIDNDRVLAVGEGTATINATTVNGSSARKPLTITVTSAGSATLSLPAATGYIEEEAFAGIPAACVVIPGDHLTIGSRAFADSAVKVVVFNATGDMDVQIAEDAFDGCGDVTLLAQEYVPQLAEYAASHGCLFITADGGIYTAPQ